MDRGQVIPKHQIDIQQQKICCKEIPLEEKMLYLKRCVSHNLVLPSNRQNNVDFGLLLIKQSLKILKDLRSIKEQIKNLHSNLVLGSAFSVIEKRNKAKIRYIKLAVEPSKVDE